MAGTEGKAVVNQCWIYHNSLLGSVQQITKVTKMAVTAPHPISCTVLIQHKHLPWTKPALGKKRCFHPQITLFQYIFQCYENGNKKQNNFISILKLLYLNTHHNFMKMGKKSKTIVFQSSNYSI